MLQEYASIILKLINDAGGNKLTNKLNLNENDKKTLSKLIDDDDNIASNQLLQKTLRPPVKTVE